MNIFENTIAAIGTSPGPGGISIVRVSGPETMQIADEIIRCAPPTPSCRDTQSIVYGHVTNGNNDIDEVLVLIMKAPRSYTCEDMIEIQGHGGRVMASLILQAVLDAGARLAEPGEFTQRAFLNGRIDLLQAEAVADIVSARTQRAAEAALDQLEGSLSRKIDRLYDDLMEISADMEASLDFSEEDIPELIINAIPSRISGITETIDNMLSSWQEGRLLRQGALIVISGLPNVGKSTLLNALLDTDRAIVSRIPGTTRDTIEEEMILDGIPLRIVDTAGLRVTECEIEKEGIERTLKHIDKADVQLHMVDASQPLSPEAMEKISRMNPDRTVLILNKTDLGDCTDIGKLESFGIIRASLTNKYGLAEIKTALRSIIEKNLDLAAPPHAVISERHRRLLLQAKDDIQKAVEILRVEDIVLSASHLREALEAIGLITGKSYGEELLNTVFSRFCIGK